VIVVDNASTVQTAQTALDTWGDFQGAQLRVVSEPHKGQSNARNRGIAFCSGDLICFIDDDVRPSIDWLRNMSLYAISTNAEAFAGKVVLPQYLHRTWMQTLHRTRLASTENLNPEKPDEMIGANMAFRRRVLEKVPLFDPELGPGALGFGDDTLFSLQLREAGYIIHFAENAVVEHHFETRRSSRRAWIKSAENRGKTHAYLTHHWEHKIIKVNFQNYLTNVMKLLRLRSYYNDISLNEEGCSVEEMNLVKKIAFAKYYLKIRKSTLHYDYHGLIKKT
jgi:cellulose synthase/poly-beta-1,6-N-acetylglucosamine synthase-like glycosyltransferase